jgi:AsmA protein
VKLIKIAGLVLVGLVVLVVAVLMFGIPAGPLVGYLSDRVEEAGYELRINGPSRVALWPYVSLAADDIHVVDKANSREDLFAASTLRVGVSLTGLLTGDIRVTEIEVAKPVIRLTSGRPAPGRAGGSAEPKDSVLRNVAIDRITVTGGTLIMRDLVENLEGRIEAIQLTASAPAKGPLDVQVEGRAGAQVLRFAAKATSLSQIAEARPTLLDARLELPGLLKTPLAFTANLKVADQMVSVDGMRGSLGTGRLNGSIAIDTGKARPHANASLSFDRLELAPDARPAPAGSPAEPWSDKPMDLALLRVFDATVKMSMRELVVGTVQIAPADIEANLAGGLLSLVLTRAQLYGGPVQGRVVMDADRRDPRHGASFEFSGIDALAFLTDATGFDKLEGRFNAKFDLTANGASPAAIVSSLGGNAELSLQNGAIRDISVPSMVRTLSNQTLQGWQDRDSEKTAFGTFSATVKLTNGQATTEDLRLNGPLVSMTGRGTADLVGRTLDFRVDPKLVLVQQGQGSAANPAGLGVPVVIKGSWSNPRIYPDIAGILENPQAAFDRLKTMGGSLFGLLREPDASGRTPQAGDVIKRLDEAIRGNSQPGQQGQPRERVQDVIRDLFRR